MKFGTGATAMVRRAIATMEEAAATAGRMLLQTQSKAQEITPRGKDFQSTADIAAEETLRNILREKYPKIPFYGEESGGNPTKEGYLWIVDPVDGSINYDRKDIWFGISIALTLDGVVIAGVIYLPCLGKMFSATRWRKACVHVAGDRKKKLVRVSNRVDITRCQFGIGWGKKNPDGTGHKQVHEIIQRLDDNSLYPQIRNSAVADMMMVAQGMWEGYIAPNLEPFDHAAAGFIIERAGGFVTDECGNTWGPFSKGIIASNGFVHTALIKMVKPLAVH